jgi:hypothetical protein
MTSTRVSPHVVALVAVVAFACFSTTQFNTNEVKAKPGKAVNAGGERPSFGPYQPASLEQYLVDNAVALGFDKTGDGEEMAFGCGIWLDTSLPVYNTTMSLKRELKNYYDKVESFEPIPDLRTLFTDGETNRDQICNLAELNPGVSLLEGFFDDSKQLSYSPQSGYFEPLLPPMRHPNLCFDGSLFNMGYMVHDFGVMCRRLKKTSRVVFIDMGASLDFHGDPMNSPPVYLLSLYRRFGFPFDHIYAFEITKKDSQEVLDAIPEDVLAAYHWINVGVSPEMSSRNNPWNLVLNSYNEDDLIIVKLDVDTACVEVPLAHQLLNDTRLHRLVDHFYFEHHVRLSELSSAWDSSMQGSVQDSLDLFHGLRQKGVPSHFWV